ncbi:hypothetical protein FQN50_009631 [Emmonsiellopsis sp. PD_5]|nr:hypothetical protein FQN50_009631 [Emmonsiellopsis sp. PD_5]
MASVAAELEELRRQLEEAKQRAEEEKVRAEEAKQRAEEEKVRADWEKQRADRAKQRADQLEADQSPTTFLVYLQLIEEKLRSTLLVEPDPTKLASGSVTDVQGKYYPRRVCQWKDFDKRRDQTFKQFTEAFSDASLFPSKTDVQGVQRDLSPATRKDEQDIRPFVRSAWEKPAQRLVQAYLRHTKDTKTTSFFFQNNAYSLSNKDIITNTTDADENEAPPRKKRSPDRKTKGVPDRWGIRELPGEICITVFVGEYKAAHKVTHGTFKRVFSSAGEDLFLDTLKRLSSPFVDTEKEHIIVARVLCQTFHYMIIAGLKYGYVTSGEALVFLMLDENDPQTLYYHLSSVGDSVGDPPSRNLDVQYGPVSQLSTFAMLSLESEPQSPQWVQDAKSQLYQWPVLPMDLMLTNPPLRLKSSCRDPSFGETYTSSSDEGHKDTDTDYRPPPQPRKQMSQLQSTETEADRRRSSRTQRNTQRPTLPYCTQACLVGLSQGRPVDRSCPNVTIHAQGSSSPTHLISKEKLCILVRNQLARNLDENCECLDRLGLFGAVGVLLKITLTGYGYTFVAKGVQAVDEKLLFDEARVYAHLSKLQGVTIPVHLGNIKLVHTYPLVSCATITSMMFMSWAGKSLHSKDYGPDVNIEFQQQRSIEELAAAGLVHDDLRRANLVWNQERQRVMVIDFDQSSIIRSPRSRRKRADNGPYKPELAVKRVRVDKENLDTGTSDILQPNNASLAWYDDADGTPTRNPFKKFRYRPVQIQESRAENGLAHTQTESNAMSRPEWERQQEMNSSSFETRHASTMPSSSDTRQIHGDNIEMTPAASVTASATPLRPSKDEDEGEQQIAEKKAPLKRRFFKRHGKGGDDDEPGQEPEDSGKDKQKFTAVGQLKATLLNSWINVLLITVPVGIALHHVHVDPIAIFVVNFVAIIPLAAMLSYATEEIALRTGETVGGLLNATFGWVIYAPPGQIERLTKSRNAVELIVSLLALFKDQIVIVQTSLIGSMLSNLLLVLGMSFFLGGINRMEQNFNVTVAQTASSLLTLAVGSLIIPTAFHAWSSAGEQGIAELSRGTSVILLGVYGAYLFFQLKSHTEMYNKPSEKAEKRRGKVGSGDASKGIAQIGAGISASMGGENAQRVPITEVEEEEVPQLSLWVALFTLAASTALVALCAEAMVGSIDAITTRGNISETFVGLILIPIVGNAAEHATAITVAIKDKMDLSIGVAVGSSMQIALLVLPLIVVIGWIAGINDMTLYFDGFQIAILFVSVLLVNYLIQDGKSHWLEGVLLMTLYLIISVAAWFYPPIEGAKGE